MLAVFLALLCLLIFTEPVFGGEPPVQISPNNGSSVASPSLNWQAPAYPLYSQGSPYRVQVDDDSTFASVDKNTYKTTTSYSPRELSEGTWYWRVMAKDTSGIWSDWSSIWSFILTIPAPSPVSSPAQTTAPSPASTSNPPTSAFTISNVPSQINSDQQFMISVNLTSSSSPNTIFYLKGAFKKADGSNYFGQTLVLGNWIKNGSSFTDQYKITTNSAGEWSGNLEVKSDSEDSGFSGTGDYIFKVGRYTSSGSGPTWSNESTIKIMSTASDQDIITTNTSSTTKPSNLPSPIKTKSSVSNQSKNYDTLVYHLASVAGATASAYLSSTPSAEGKVNKQKQTNPLIWIGAIFIIAGGGSIGYIYLKKNAKIPFML